MKRALIALAIAATLGGCANHAIQFERASVVPGTVSVSPFGFNYKISAFVESDEKRTLMEVFAADCAERHGDIWDGGAGAWLAENALLDGPAPKDKLFTQICSAGLPMVSQAMQR